MVAIAIVFEHPMESEGGRPVGAFIADAILDNDVEKPIVIVVGECRALVSRAIILERRALRSGYVSECAVTVIVIKKVVIPDGGARRAGVCNKQIQESVVIVISPGS